MGAAAAKTKAAAMNKPKVVRMIEHRMAVLLIFIKLLG
jgi:hypothetical protein